MAFIQVEDDLFNANYLKEILAGFGLNILHTVYGNEAIQLAKSQKIDIILMDIRLPDIDGYTTTRLIRKVKPDIKIIAQTAYAAHDDRVLAISSGCNEYVSKPIKKEVLLAMINKQLN